LKFLSRGCEFSGKTANRRESDLKRINKFLLSTSNKNKQRRDTALANSEEQAMTIIWPFAHGNEGNKFH